MCNKFAVATGRLFAGRQQCLMLALLLLSGAWSTVLAAPANDNFGSAKLIVGTSGNTTGNNLGATAELGEPFHADPTAVNSIWFRWVAPASGPVVFTTDHADTFFDTTLAVYTGTTFTNLLLVAANNDSSNTSGALNLGSGRSSYVQFTANAGTTYYIALAGVNTPPNNPPLHEGNYRMLWSMGGYAGTFQFTSSLFEASERESNSPRYSIMDPFTIRGARISLTRDDGFSGRVRVTYRVTDTASATNGSTFTVPGAATDFTALGYAKDVLVYGTNAFLTASNNIGFGSGGFLRVIDVSNPALPVHMATVSLTGSPGRMVKRGNLLYVAAGLQGLVVFDITAPKNPVLYGQIFTGGSANDVVLKPDGSLAYVATGDNGFSIVTLDGNGIPTSIAGQLPGPVRSATGFLPILPYNQKPVTAVDTTNDLITSAGHGLANGMEVRFLVTAGNLPAGILPSTGYYVRNATVNNFELSATPGGARLDITSVGSGTISFEYVTGVNVASDRITYAGGHGLNNNDMVVFSGTSMPGGIVAGTIYYAEVINANDIRLSTTTGGGGLLGNFTPVDITSGAYADLAASYFQNTLAAGGSSVGIALSTDENHVYLADNGGGFGVFNVQNPAAITKDVVLTLGVVTGVKNVGTTVYLANDTGGTLVLDCSNPASPTLVTRINPAGAVKNVSIFGSVLYAATSTGVTTIQLPTHTTLRANTAITGGAESVWLDESTPSSRYMYAAAGFSGLQILRKPLTIPTSVLVPGYAFSSLSSQTNTVIFDDWQTSASFLINPIATTNTAQVDLDIVKVELMPGESPAVLAPKISTTRNSSTLEITDQTSRINFEHTRMRVAESAGTARINVIRGQGIADGSITRYEINGNRISPSNTGSPGNNIFPLDSGSDYATPTTDFENVSGTLSWGAGVTERSIDVDITNDSLVEFNEDFRIDLFVVSGDGGNPGQTDHCYVTIVADNQVDAEMAAGAVDSSYNRDYYSQSSPPFNPTPGANDQVHAVALDGNQRAIFGGDFTAVNTDANYPRLARFDANGDLDTTFQIGTGPNSSVLSVAVSGTQIYIAGKFNSYNSIQARGIARITSNGSLDGSFNVGAGISNPSATPVRALAVHQNGAHAGKVVAVGDFTSFAGQTMNRIARLTSTGSLDGAFNSGTGANGSIYAVKILENTGALGLDGYILIAGNFTSYNGQSVNRIARLTPTGSLDPNFKVGSGANGAVYALDVKSNGVTIIGGDFTAVDLIASPRVAQLNANGSLDTNFEIGVGADDTVFTAKYDASGRVLIGGLFRNYNFVRRAGYARLLPSGYLDTSFMDIAYNHFAGLPMRFSVMADPKPFVRAMALQSNGDIIIGGSFQRVGGGYRNTDPRLINVTSASPWRDGQDNPIVTPYWQNRDDIRNRSNIARVKGGATPGPGNIGFTSATYSVDEYASQLFVTLSRDNTDPDAVALGDVQTEFFTQQSAAVPGTALSTLDYGTPLNTLPRWRSNYNTARMVSQSRTGPNNQVLGVSRVEIPIVDDSLIEGDETFTTRLINPKSNLRLGGSALTSEGEIIPLGIALGRASATVKIVDDDFEPTFVSFSKPRYTVTENGGTATIEVSRTGSTSRSISVDYLSTEHLGLAGGDIEETASQAADFTGVFGRLTFGPGETNLSFTIPITDDVTTETDESINLYIYNLSPGASFSTRDQNFLPAAVNTGSSQITIPGHGLYNDTELKFISTGALPGGLSAGTSYYALVIDADTIQVALAPGDTPVTLTTTGAGTHTAQAVQNLSRLVIYDNDFSNGTLRFSSSTKYSVTEGATVTVTVERTGGNVGAIQVDYATFDGTATIASSDYAGASGTLTWNHLDTAPKSFTVATLADGLVESALENFTVQLSGAKRLSDNLAIPIASPNPITVEIADTDRYGTLQFASPNFSVSENGGNAIITITRTAGSSETVMVNVVDLATGTAASPTHYSFTPITVTMQPGVTSTNVIVSIVDDAGAPVQNVNRTVNLGLQTPINASLGTVVATTLTIVDNETINEPAGSVDTTYNPLAGTDGFIYGMTLQTDEKLIVGGNFSKMNGITSPRLARLDKTGQLDAGFSTGTGPNDTVRSVLVQEDGRIVIAGLFTNFNGVSRSHIARLNFNGLLDLSFDPGVGADNPIYAIGLHRDSAYYGKMVVVGEFSSIGGFNRPGVARLDTNGAVDTTFSTGTGPNGTVYAVAMLPDGKVLIGGEFTSVNQNTNYPYLARLNSDGSLDTSFSTANKLDGTVRAIAVQSDGGIVVGGNFLNAGSTSRPFIARLLAGGALDSTFDPGVGGDQPVLSLAIQPDGKILVGGDFTRFSGVTRSRVTRLNSDGTPDPKINFGSAANSFVSSILVQPSDGRIILGGGFTQFAGLPRNYLVRLFGGVIDGPGYLEFNVPEYTVSESETNAVILVRRTGGTTGSVGVQLDTANLTPAGAGKADAADYVAVANQSFTFPNAETFQEVRITINQDTLIEGDELLSLLLSNPTAAPPFGLGNQSVAQLRIVDDDSYVFFKQTLISVNENDPSGVVLVEVGRTGGISGTLSVRMVTTNGTAVAGSDYTATSTVLNFQAGETNKTVAIPIVNDAFDEGTETFTIGLTLITGEGAVRPIGSMTTVSILNDDFAPGVVQFVQSGYTIDENGAVVTLGVVRTNGSSGTISVSYNTVSTGDAVGGVAAAAGVDFIHTNGSLAFADGERVKFINVRILPDNDAGETNETFQVQLSNPTGGSVIGFPNPATVSIVNNNSAIFGQFNVSAVAPITEGNTATVTVNLTGRTTNQPVTVDYVLVGQSATVGSDFIAASGTLTFPDLVTAQTFDITTLTDNLVEPTETLQIVLSNPLPGNGPSITTPTTDVSILNTTSLPGTVVFAQPVFTALENALEMEIVVERTNGVTGAVSVDLALSPGTAANPADYTDFVGAPITVAWADGVGGAVTNKITLINDAIVEADETILITMSNPTGNLIFATNGTTQLNQAVGVIVDDETKAGSVDELFAPTADGPVYQLAIWPGTNRISLVGDFRTVNSLPRANVAQLNLDGSILAGFDPGAVTLGGGNATIRSIVIYTNGTNVGRVVVGGRFDSINGVPVNNIARLNADGTVDTSFIIGQGPNAPVNALQLQPDGKILLGGDFNMVNGNTANFVARLNDNGTLDASFAIGSGADGPVNAMLLLDNGDIVVGGEFNLFADVAAAKLARLNSAGALVTTFATNLGTGFNNSVFALAQQQNLKIVVGGAFTTVNGSPYNYMVRLLPSGAIDTAVFTGFGSGFNDSVFTLAIQPDQKILAGGNFTELNGVPHNRIVRLLSSGAVDPTINFGTGADGFVNTLILQPDEKILIGGGFQVVDGYSRPSLARLNNGTNSGSGVFQFAASQFLVNENEATVGVTVSRLLGTAKATSVDVITVDGTATNAVHYQGSVTTLTFAEGETTKELRLPVLDDLPGFTNANRIFYVQMQNPTNDLNGTPFLDGALLASRTNVPVVIVDNESVISFSSVSYVVAENGGNAIVSLTRTGGSNDPVAVRLETTFGTAIPSSDYTPVTNDIAWAAGDASTKIVLIPILDDTLVEGIETVSMQLTNFSGSALPGVTNSVLNIIDDDFSSGIIAFEQDTYNVVESQPAQIVVVRTNGSSGIVSAVLTTANGTAFGGSDYTTTNILVTFANGETRKVVNIATLDDGLQDDGETFTVNLANPSGGATLGTATATVIIDDNDVTIGFSAASLNVTESDTTLLLTVTRSGLDTRTFIIDYTTANGTAQAGLDYLQTNGVVVFGPFETNKVIEVQVKDDFVIEGPETFLINLSGPSLSLLGNQQTVITIDDNDLATDLEVLVSVNNPVKTNTMVSYTVLVTNYGPSDISGITLTNVLPSSLELQSVSVPTYTAIGKTLIFDLPVLPKAAGYQVVINALDTNGVIRSVTNLASIGLPSVTNDLNLANNSVTNVTGLRGPGPYLAVESLSIASESPGPANGAFDINEQVSVNVTFRNLGDQSTVAATGSLQGTGGVLTNLGPQNVTFGALAPNASAVKTFNFKVTGTNGGALILTFPLADTGGIVYDPGVLRYRLGGSTLNGTTNQITINALGDATPYPSTVVVAGLVGILDQVSLTLSNVSHTYPADIDMLLVGPTGQGVIVMSDAGGDKILNNVTFTISDQASTVLPENGQILNGGSYIPANYPAPDADVFGSPAPVAPYFSTLSAFRGIDPNGQWKLFVRDDTTGDFGAISNGWSLNITTVFPANPTAGLVIAGTQTAGPLLIGQDQTYALVVTNRGPATATSVFVTNTFSSAFTFISASNSVTGAVTQPSGRVVLAQGILTNGAVVTNYVTVRPTVAGSFTNLATVGIASSETDPFLGDNTIVFAQTVGANADLAVGVTTSPAGTVALGNNLTYTIALTNLGPSTATSVVLTDILPSGVTYISGTPTQGVVSRSGSQVTATLGSLAVNGVANLTIVVTPTTTGSLTNSVTASSAVADAVSTNNVAVTAVTAVTDSADLQVSLAAAPNPVTVGANITYTIALTNKGPSTATGVVVTNPLPSSVTLVSFTPAQGTAANVSGAVVFSLGSVPTGTNLTMQVVVTANTAGAVNSTALASASGTFDPVAGNNSATLAVAVQSPSADIDLGASSLLAESITPSNGAIDPGETVTLSLELVNKGAAATANLVASLLPTGGVITNSPQVQTYGAIASGARVAKSFTFTANGNLGDTLSVTLQLQDGASNLGTVTFTYQLGATKNAGSSTTITGVDSGAALTYPSIINVSGVSGTILKATITLSNVSHTFPDDFDILLVSPSGNKVLLISDVGGGFALNGVNITLDDNATSSLPDSGAIADGVYKPSNYLNSPVDPLSTNDVFAAPAPSGPYAAKLADLVGTNPNGQWQLYVMDDQAGNLGSIGGWSLSLVTVATIAPSADVALSVTRSPEPVTARSNLTYTITVTNSGPNAVNGVTVSNRLPANVTLVSMNPDQGTTVTNGVGSVIWTIGSLPVNSRLQATIVIAPDLPGSITNVATVTHTDIELNSSNNSATTVSTVTGVVLSGGSIAVSGGNVSMMLVGMPGVTYVVEASTNLVDWVVISTQSSADGIITINDPSGAGSGLRFYRARQQ